MRTKFIVLQAILCFMVIHAAMAEDGYRLWLRFDAIDDASLLEDYRSGIEGWKVYGTSPTMDIVRKELQEGLSGMLGVDVNELGSTLSGSMLLAGKKDSDPFLRQLSTQVAYDSLGDEGFAISTVEADGRLINVITANTDIGVLYGVYHFLRKMQMHESIDSLAIQSSPRIDIRILNHWDNLDRTVERGYAGFSIWDWHRLPELIDPRYTQYARANASIGINSTVLTNVNANALVLSPYYLERVKALADIFRPYGIKVFLTARFSAPIELGGLETADPLDETVINWWHEKVDEIYKYVPDFGGFLVKANSEGQPGPQNYDRSHADGANLLADAVKDHGGIVMWRAFVYSNEEPEDRAKQAYNEFVPLDGEFRDNVLIQVKNGAIDFQPREPFHPLFGALKETAPMMEFQITQEYLGQGTHLVYQGPLYKEVLDADTYARGQGSSVARVLDGSVDPFETTGMAGVSNIGNDRNWTGHLFGQSNWYVFGRLAWDHTLSAEEIAEEWTRCTFSNDPEVVQSVTGIMMESHENLVDYMTPLGLHHIMGPGHHYGPGPWVSQMPRADWTSVYYHKADREGIGFDRTASGSDAISQYFPGAQPFFNDPETIDEKYLLWFHHLPWDFKTKSGRTLWDEIVFRYYSGVEAAKGMHDKWQDLEGLIDEGRWEHVNMMLERQVNEAILWRNSCVLYFQQFSGLPIGAEYEKPAHSLEYYENMRHPYAPGIRPRW